MQIHWTFSKLILKIMCMQNPMTAGAVRQANYYPVKKYQNHCLLKTGLARILSSLLIYGDIYAYFNVYVRPSVARAILHTVFFSFITY